jgi:hypothetical protein
MAKPVTEGLIKGLSKPSAGMPKPTTPPPPIPKRGQ